MKTATDIFRAYKVCAAGLGELPELVLALLDGLRLAMGYERQFTLEKNRGGTDDVNNKFMPSQNGAVSCIAEIPVSDLGDVLPMKMAIVRNTADGPQYLISCFNNQQLSFNADNPEDRMKFYEYASALIYKYAKEMAKPSTGAG